MFGKQFQLKSNLIPNNFKILIMNILKNYLKVIVYDGFMYFDLCINVKSFNFIRNSNRIGDLESDIYQIIVISIKESSNIAISSYRDQ